MSDQPEQPVRRVGRKDRKRSLDSRKPLIPEDDQFAPPQLSREESDSEIVAEAELDAPEAELEAESEPVVEAAPPVTTPSAARFPPLDPDAYAPTPKPAPAPPRKRRNWLYNLLTLFFALATIGAIAYFALLWRNPYHPLNPLPPFTPLPIIITTTPLPATETPLPTETEPAPTATFTPIGVEVVLPTAPSFPYTLAELDTEYIQSASGCDESAIAGSVLDAQGAGVNDLTVRVRGEESDFTGESLSGSAPDFDPGGFEIQLADAPQIAPFVVQLFSADETPLSEEYLVVTSDQCEQNTVVVRFTQQSS
jgi:hypothetical protein